MNQIITRVIQPTLLLSFVLFAVSGCEQKPPDLTAAPWDRLVVYYCEGTGPDVVQYKWETRDAATLKMIQAAYKPSKYAGLSTMFNSTTNKLQIEVKDEVWILWLIGENLGVLHEKGKDHPVHNARFPDTHFHDTLQQILNKETGRNAQLLYPDEVNVTQGP